jgi:hypothetical protein
VLLWAAAVVLYLAGCVVGWRLSVWAVTRRASRTFALAESVGVVADGSHDRYPHLPDEVRQLTVAYCEAMWAQPERAK